MLFFFFFQAEDGIRDWSVTGVQTCALPICPRDGRQVRGRGRPPRAALPSAEADPVPAGSSAVVPESPLRGGRAVPPAAAPLSVAGEPGRRGPALTDRPFSAGAPQRRRDFRTLG